MTHLRYASYFRCFEHLGKDRNNSLKDLRDSISWELYENLPVVRSSPYLRSLTPFHFYFALGMGIVCQTIFTQLKLFWKEWSVSLPSGACCYSRFTSPSPACRLACSSPTSRTAGTTGRSLGSGPKFLGYRAGSSHEAETCKYGCTKYIF